MQGLEPDASTKQLIAEAFADKVCSNCGAPACKLANGAFFCRRCVRPRAQIGADEEFCPAIVRTIGLKQSPIRRGRAAGTRKG